MSQDARARLNDCIQTGAGAARIRRIAPNPNGGLEALFAINGPFLTTRPDTLHAQEVQDVPPVNPRASRLRLFHVNDLHNHLYDETDTGTVHRLAQMQHCVAQARATAGPDEAVLFLSAGDDHTGTILDELVGWGAADFVLDPGYTALSAAGADAAAIGNHEFDRGAAQLKRGLRDAAFPLVSANVHGSAHMEPGEDYHAGLLAVVGGVRIGIAGLTTRVETRTGQPSDPGLAVASPVEVLANLLPLLDKISDVVVILSHCGYGDGNHTSGKAAAARDIGEADFALAEVAAQVCRKPVVIVGAHTHTRLNEHGVEPENLRGGVLITQGEANGRFLGEIDIDLNGRAPISARLLPTVGGATDARFVAQVIAPIRTRVEDLRAQVIGQVTTPGLDWAATRVSRYGGECALANYMNDALVTALGAAGTPVDLGMVNGGSLLAGIAPGPLSFGDWFGVMPYSDEVFIVEATGEQLTAILASNAQRLLRAEEVADTHVDGFLPRGFLQFSSRLRYRIDPGNSAAQARARDVGFDGAALTTLGSQRLRIATTTYLALGSFGERWNGAALSGGVPGELAGYDLRALPHENTGLVYRDVLTRHIRQTGTVAAATDGRLTVGTGTR